MVPRPLSIPDLFLHREKIFFNGQSWPLFRLFSTNIYVKKCPSILQYWDSNPRPSGHEFHPITTGPGLPPYPSDLCRPTIAIWTNVDKTFIYGLVQQALGK